MARFIVRRLCCNLDGRGPLDGGGSPVSPALFHALGPCSAHLSAGVVFRARERDEKRRWEERGRKEEGARWRRCRVIRMQTAIVIAHRNTQPVFRPASLLLSLSLLPLVLAKTPTPLTSGRETRKRGERARGVNFKVDPNTRPLPSRQSSALSGFTFLRLRTRSPGQKPRGRREEEGFSRPKLKRSSQRARTLPPES